jgi:hypothetical protein
VYVIVCPPIYPSVSLMSRSERDPTQRCHSSLHQLRFGVDSMLFSKNIIRRDQGKVCNTEGHLRGGQDFMDLLCLDLFQGCMDLVHRSRG